MAISLIKKFILKIAVKNLFNPDQAINLLHILEALNLKHPPLINLNSQLGYLEYKSYLPAGVTGDTLLQLLYKLLFQFQSLFADWKKFELSNIYIENDDQSYPFYLLEVGNCDILFRLFQKLLQFSICCTDNPKSLGYILNQNIQINQALQEYGIGIQSSKILEVGSGMNNPVGSSLLSLVLGAKFVAAIEPGPILADIDQITNRILQELIYHFPNSSQTLFEAVNFQKLNSGQFFKSLNERLISFEQCSIEQFNPDCQFDIVYSNSVLEHVMNLPDQISHLSNLTRNGGYHIHKVDFIDHQFYEIEHPSELNRFKFLFEQHVGPVGTTNRLRLSQMIKEFEADHQFHLLKIHEHWKMSFPKAYRNLLAPQFRYLELEDLETTCATLVFVKN